MHTKKKGAIKMDYIIIAMTIMAETYNFSYVFMISVYGYRPKSTVI